MSARPYQISVPQSRIERLQQKLALADWPDELESSGWDYGVPRAEVKRLAEYWHSGYDWRKHEAKLNEVPQFVSTVDVDGYGALSVHFVHQQSPTQGAIPLLFVHGWPGSYYEVLKLLDVLKADTQGPAFHVVAPSLPNFGWSDGVGKRGFGLAQYAEACHKVMQGLGYSQYVTQGGDWGFYITRTIGLLYPDSCKGSHSNMVRASPPKLTSQPLLALRHLLTPYTPREKAGLARTAWFLDEGSGYRLTQSTKPQTLGYTLADSPVGLLAWILEKLHDWTDEYPWTDDEILTWISIYAYSTPGPAASLRIYFEAVHQPGLDLHSNTLNPSAGPDAARLAAQRQRGAQQGGYVSRQRTQEWIARVPLGLAFFPKELGVPPRLWGRTLGKVVLESDKDKGGHFAAFERPGDVAADLGRMFGRGGPCAGVVAGASGY